MHNRSSRAISCTIYLSCSMFVQRSVKSYSTLGKPRVCLSLDMGHVPTALISGYQRRIPPISIDNRPRHTSPLYPSEGIVYVKGVYPEEHPFVTLPDLLQSPHYWSSALGSTGRTCKPSVLGSNLMTIQIYWGFPFLSFPPPPPNSADMATLQRVHLRCNIVLITFTIITKQSPVSPLSLHDNDRSWPTETKWQQNKHWQTCGTHILCNNRTLCKHYIQCQCTGPGGKNRPKCLYELYRAINSFT